MRLIVILVLLATVSCGADGGPANEDTTNLRPHVALDRAALGMQIERLAHDSMHGRGSASEDELRAAQYIAGQFHAIGLLPPAGAYLAQFIVPPARVGGRANVTSHNVVGILPGSGALQHEWIVLGAHYDHVGMRPLFDGTLVPYNGADDNASGTAVILEVARYLVSYTTTGGFGNRPRRSVMFHAYGSEELGLIGSETYCAAPVYPLLTVTAMLNFDMVGRLRNNTLMLGGLPTAAQWPALLAKSNTQQLVIAETDCSACTDFACFRRNLRPVLWFFTGLHDDYHRETDDTERINVEGVGQIADLAVRIVSELLVTTQPPVFKSAN